MTIQWKSLAVAMTMLAGASALAGPFTTTLSDTDAKQIKRLALVSTLGDTLHARQVGLTAFQNKSFDARVATWNLDVSVTTKLKERIIANSKISGDIESLIPSSSDKKAILDAARDKGFDAVLVIRGEGNVHDSSIVPGPILLRRKLPGVDKLYTCNGMALHMYRVSDGRRIGFAVPSACSDSPNVSLVWHEAWLDFTPDEQRRTLDALQSYIHQQVGSALLMANVVSP
jgi:hypothetical protein